MSPQDAARFAKKWTLDDRDRPSTPCPSCGRRLRPKNLRNHARKLHPIEIDA